MTKNRFKWSAIVVAFAATTMASTAALAVNEQEPNSPLVGYAQPLTFDSNNAVQVYGKILNWSGKPRDIDFYSFQANAGDVFNIYMTNAWQSSKYYTWTDLGLFGPYGGQPYHMFFESEFNNGSITADRTIFDPSIENFTAPTTGTYYVGVSSNPGQFTSYNTLVTGDLASWSPWFNVQDGTYTLHIDLAKPPVMQIGIDIKPGSKVTVTNAASGTNGPATKRGAAKGSIPIAILSTDNFDARTVDQDSLHFGKTGKEETFVSCNGGHGTDVNRDGKLDLICHFNLSKAGFDETDSEGILTGKTDDGQDFEGSGWLKIVTLGAHGPKK